jgi:hypothetical protein
LHDFSVITIGVKHFPDGLLDGRDEFRTVGYRESLNQFLLNHFEQLLLLFSQLVHFPLLILLLSFGFFIVVIKLFL